MLFQYATDNWFEATLERLPEFVKHLDKKSEGKDDEISDEDLAAFGLKPLPQKTSLIQEVLEDVLSMSTPQTCAFESAIDSKLLKLIAIGYKWSSKELKKKKKNLIEDKIDEKIESIKSEKLRTLLETLRSL